MVVLLSFCCIFSEHLSKRTPTRVASADCILVTLVIASKILTGVKIAQESLVVLIKVIK